MCAKGQACKSEWLVLEFHHIPLNTNHYMCICAFFNRRKKTSFQGPTGPKSTNIAPSNFSKSQQGSGCPLSPTSCSELNLWTISMPSVRTCLCTINQHSYWSEGENNGRVARNVDRIMNSSTVQNACMTHYDEAFGNKKKEMILMISTNSGGYAVWCCMLSDPCSLRNLGLCLLNFQTHSCLHVA